MAVIAVNCSVSSRLFLHAVTTVIISFVKHAQHLECQLQLDTLFHCTNLIYRHPPLNICTMYAWTWSTTLIAIIHTVGRGWISRLHSPDCMVCLTRTSDIILPI